MPTIGTGSGTMVAVEQNTGIIGSGNIFAIEQNVRLRIVGDGTIINIEQNVGQTFSGTLISVCQNVQNSTTATQASLVSQGLAAASRNGFTVKVYINGKLVPASKVANVDTIRSIGEAAQATITLIPAAGVQDMTQYQGRTVKITAKTRTGQTRAIFRGWIDTPSLDVVDKKIVLQCSDRRKNQIMRLSEGYIKRIGYYSDDIFGTNIDKYHELTSRLQTVTQDFDFSPYLQPTLTSWTPKVTPDYTFNNSTVFYDKPTITFANKHNAVNTINITFDYSYQRLHSQKCVVSWPGYTEFCRDWADVGYPSFPSKELVIQAAEAGGWIVTAGIYFDELWTPGWYRCAIAGDIVWNPNQGEYSYVPKNSQSLLASNGSTTFSNGQKYIAYENVTDRNSNNMYTPSLGEETVTGGALCKGADWTAALKFAQTIHETYTLAVKSPQAITRYGIIDDTLTASVTDDFTETDWSSDTSRTGYSVNVMIDRDTNRKRIRKSIRCAYEKARATIRAAHRDTEISFRTNLKPEIDLVHTVRINTDNIDAKGKVKTIKHSFSAEKGWADTTITLIFSTSITEDSETNYDITSPITESDRNTYADTDFRASLGTHLGQDPAIYDPTGSWTGYIGNKNLTPPSQPIYRTTYAEMFVVTYPGIPDRIRKQKDLAASYTFNITIPNDDLEVTF